ncbi:MAG TPA: pyridoxamine 5'-phosphate oxidase family protein [Nocardiopsis listeri]|uniref:pyridoxamine 5'-phosphate oxidase family protein n=1 Tax=Nocardiopsis listeri TaxID=53440 RepID=UPI001DC15EC0|nr:pyridoxamine 5'-phosphate oxidase family protein [Nocardiopsis listeri]HJE58799.1 pyridoxamine 5'-phosphate oxidase family protein [Nocardiopsis listeri]
MTDHLPTGTEAPTGAPAAGWTAMLQELSETAGTYWLTATRDGSVPHTRPLLAVWARGLPHFACGQGTAKARLLTEGSPVSLAVSTDHWDVVVEGPVERVRDTGRVRVVAETYPVVYGWAPLPEGDLLVGPDGAPTAGPPPYAVFVVRTSTVYAFPTDATGHGPTRWRFAPPEGS